MLNRRGPTEWAKFIAAPALGMQGLHAYFNKHQYERHSHDYFVLGTIDAGASRVALEYRDFVAPAGSAMIINPGDVHDGRAYAEQGYIYSMLYIDPWVIDDIAQEFDIAGDTTLFFTHPVISDPDVVLTLKQLHRSLFNQQDPLAHEIHLIDALRPLISRFSTRRVTLSTVTAEPRIERVRELIHACFAQPLSTADMAAAAGISRVRLNQLFRAAYGLPLHAYLNGVRLEAAKKLLQSGQNAAEVAQAIGLFDQSHLIRRFKGRFGITPAQFLNGHFSNIQYSQRPISS